MAFPSKEGCDGGVSKYSADDDRSRTAAVITDLAEKVTDVHCQKRLLFVVTMKNYVTLPEAIPMLTEIGIGCLGTTRI